MKWLKQNIIISLIISASVTLITFGIIDGIYTSRKHDKKFVESEFKGKVLDFKSVSRGGILMLDTDTFNFVEGMCLRGELYAGDSIVKEKGEAGFNIYEKNENGKYNKSRFIQCY